MNTESTNATADTHVMTQIRLATKRPPPTDPAAVAVACAKYANLCAGSIAFFERAEDCPTEGYDPIWWRQKRDAARERSRFFAWVAQSSEPEAVRYRVMCATMPSSAHTMSY